MTAKTNKQLILQYAAKVGGVGNGEIPGVALNVFHARCAELVAAGKLYRSGAGSKHTRYHTDQAAARAADNARNPTRVKAMAPMTKAQWAPDARTVINDRTKITIVPTPQPRFCAVELHVKPAIQSGRVTT